MLQTEFVQKIKTQILCSTTFSENSAVYELMWEKYCCLGDNVEKCTARQATDDYIMRRMRIACWIPTATGSHSEHVIIVAL